MFTQEKILLLVIGVLLFGSTQAMAQSQEGRHLPTEMSVIEQRQHLDAPVLSLRGAMLPGMNIPSLASLDTPLANTDVPASAPDWAGLDTALNHSGAAKPVMPAVA